MPGVYIFKDKKGLVLYVGKANNLRKRVRSYFRPVSGLGPKTVKLVSLISTIDHIKVQSEIEALLLESRLIKKFNPPFNISAKDDSSPYYIQITNEKWPRPVISHQPAKSIAGPFLNGKIPRQILRRFRRVSPYCIAHRPVRKPCLYSHLGLCNPCPGLGDESKLPEYQKNIRRLKSLLRGNFASVKSQLNREMKSLAKAQKFESAGLVKKSLEALSYIENQPVSPEEYIANPNLLEDMKRESLEALVTALSPIFDDSDKEAPLHRIEMYDVAHLSGTSATAAMTVALDGFVMPDKFRHFTIKISQTTSDVDMMKEVLARRLKRSDWPSPDLIVLDGGKPQLSSVLSLSGHGLKLPVVISLAKQFETVIVPLSDGYREINLTRDNKGLLLLMHLRDEAHRFSRRLHHLHRSRLSLT